MMRRFVSKLRRDARGTAAIELALIAPMLATLVVGVIDMSNGYSRKLELEQAVQRSLEMVLQTTGNDTAEDAIIGQVVAQAGVTAEQVVVARRLECDAVVVADITEECDPDEMTARYITVSVTDTYDPMFAMTFGNTDANGNYRLSATAGMRTQ